MLALPSGPLRRRRNATHTWQRHRPCLAEKFWMLQRTTHVLGISSTRQAGTIMSLRRETDDICLTSGPTAQIGAPASVYSQVLPRPEIGSNSSACPSAAWHVGGPPHPRLPIVQLNASIIKLSVGLELQHEWMYVCSWKCLNPKPHVSDLVDEKSCPCMPAIRPCLYRGTGCSQHVRHARLAICPCCVTYGVGRKQASRLCVPVV